VQTEGQAQEEGAMGYHHKEQGQQPAGKDDNLASWTSSNEERNDTKMGSNNNFFPQHPGASE
jgi:hypothetical protein